MKQSLFEIAENIKLTDSIMKMRLAGDTSAITAPGTFVNIKLDGFFLRRPISVNDYDSNSLTIIYKIVGKGTEQLSKMQSGTLDILTGLGNGYDTSLSGEKPLLIGYENPEIAGIGIVCSGGDDARKREEVISVVSSAFDIPTNKIFVVGS